MAHGISDLALSEDPSEAALSAQVLGSGCSCPGLLLHGAWGPLRQAGKLPIQCLPVCQAATETVTASECGCQTANGPTSGR
jgi:hypothetical protein